MFIFSFSSFKEFFLFRAKGEKENRVGGAEKPMVQISIDARKRKCEKKNERKGWQKIKSERYGCLIC